MSIEKQITDKVQHALAPEYYNIDNESHNHGNGTGTSHFRLVIVSSQFEGLRLIMRHRKVNGLLAEELAGEVHALALHTFTPEEWQRRGESANSSPACAGGG